MSASRTSWSCVPFSAGVSLPWSSTVTPDAAEILQRGWIPRSMDDKWFVYFEAPHLYLHRSWTGAPVYRLTLSPTSLGVELGDARWVAARPDPAPEQLVQEARALGYLIQTLLDAGRRLRR